MEWIAIEDRLPPMGQQVFLLNELRYWNTPSGVPDAHVTASGYLTHMGDPYWVVFGARGQSLDAYTHWCAVGEV